MPALSFVKVHSFCETVSSECTAIRFKYVIFKSVIFLLPFTGIGAGSPGTVIPL